MIDGMERCYTSGRLSSSLRLLLSEPIFFNSLILQKLHNGGPLFLSKINLRAASKSAATTGLCVMEKYLHITIARLKYFISQQRIEEDKLGY